MSHAQKYPQTTNNNEKNQNKYLKTKLSSQYVFPSNKRHKINKKKIKIKDSNMPGPTTRTKVQAQLFCASSGKFGTCAWT